MNIWNEYFEGVKQTGKFSLQAKDDVIHWTNCMVGHRDFNLSGLLSRNNKSIRLLSPHVIELGKRVKDFVLNDNVIESKKIYDEINSIGRKEFYRFVPIINKIQKLNKTVIITFTCPKCIFTFKKQSAKCPNCKEVLEWSDVL